MEDDENNEDVMFTLCNFKYVFTDLVNDSLKSEVLMKTTFLASLLLFVFYIEMDRQSSKISIKPLS